MSIPILPLAGMLVDRIGRRCELMTGSFIVIFASYCLMLFGPTYEVYEPSALIWVMVP